MKYFVNGVYWYSNLISIIRLNDVNIMRWIFDNYVII